MANFSTPLGPNSEINPTLPPIRTVTDIESCFMCDNCSYCYSELAEFTAHRTQCPVVLPARQRSDRHDSVHSSYSFAGSDSGHSEELVYTPDVSRASSVARSCHRVRRISRAETKTSKRHRRHSPGPVLDSRGKKAKKTEKEKLNRSNQAAVMYRMEDILEHYCGWSKIEQSGGNGNSAGLYSSKINVLRAYEATGLVLFHRSRCASIQSGNLAEFEAEMAAIAEAATKEDYRPGDNSFLELPLEEKPCTHQDTRVRECFAHGHSDWRVCRKAHMKRTMSRNEGAYLARLGLTRQQARHGHRMAQQQHQQHHQHQQQGRSTVLPHRSSRH